MQRKRLYVTTFLLTPKKSIHVRNDMQSGEVQGWQEDRNTKRQSAAGFHYPHERVERAVEIRHMLQNLLAHDYVIGVRWNLRITASVAAGAHQRDRMEEPIITR